MKINYVPTLAYSRDTTTTGIADAVAAAQSADAIIVAAGEESILSGEAHCLANLNLQGAQTALIDALAATGKPLVTVIMAGRPLCIGHEAEVSGAMLYAFHPGTMGGPALADIIFGKVSPSGKTPVTFPKSVGQIPSYYAKNNTGRPAAGTETLIDEVPLEAGQTSLGCTSFWMDEGFGPLYPFGYGLSYGDFEYSNLKLDSGEYPMNGVIKASATLTNKGARKATEVAQLYVRDNVGSITRPVKELKRFSRVELEPGQSATVSFELPVEELAFWGLDLNRSVEPGEFTLWIGGDSQSGLNTNFTVNDSSLANK